MEATANNESTTTETPPKNAQPKSLGLRLILLPNIRPRFCCCQRENMLSSGEGFLTYPMYHQWQIYTYYQDSKKTALSHWQSELKINPSCATVGPAKDNISRWPTDESVLPWSVFQSSWSLKVTKGAKIRDRYNQAPHLTHREFRAFLIPNDVFFVLLFSMTKEIKITSLKNRLECWDFRF